ncbi:MAG: molybdenum cofactor biosynthesis protein MoaE [bacterium]|nr:molybdenum cofactor biosynthesis protein MoaE [bacterium]
MVSIVENIDLNLAYKQLSHNSSGGICLFVGTVRDHTNKKEVNSLEFEAYAPMAIKEMEKLISRANEEWPLNKVVIQHVVGKKEIGEPVVVIGASAAHRDAAFASCRFLIDELKKTVPIWKREVFIDESVWVSAHP